MDEWKDRQTDR